MPPSRPDTPATQNKLWTTRQLLQWTTEHFAKKGVDSPRLSAEMLLAHILGVQRLKLYMDPDRPTSELERAALRDLVERAAAFEPVDYLTGMAPFFAMQIAVTPDVLIPRPSTETAVEHVIQHARRTPGFNAPLIADIGTGSGAIALAIAKHLPHSKITATDISPQALAVAAKNAARLSLEDQIDFVQGDLLTALPTNTRYRYLIANPPYISDSEWEQVLPNVKDYEPTLALRAGIDGLKYLRPLIQNARPFLDLPGQLILEIASSQKQQVLDLVAQHPGYANAHILADHEGLPRILVADSV